jgi:rubrerythrin
MKSEKVIPVSEAIGRAVECEKTSERLYREAARNIMDRGVRSFAMSVIDQKAGHIASLSSLLANPARLAEKTVEACLPEEAMPKGAIGSVRDFLEILITAETALSGLYAILQKAFTDDDTEFLFKCLAESAKNQAARASDRFDLEGFKTAP